mmetsp:Transcript_28636/g.39316  ORF Transcript_28636/g.39316 Transcript_28636/m.39316 type:complete len:3966 (-) Transcript_28636:995-12892(-)
MEESNETVGDNHVRCYLKVSQDDANKEVCVEILGNNSLIHTSVDKTSTSSRDCISIYNPLSTFIEEKREFTFDQVFSPDSDAEDLYLSLQKDVMACIQGGTATIIAYGPTGSGKTKTMCGFETSLGVISIAVTNIFKEMERSNVNDFQVKVSVLELHNNRLHPLTAADVNNLRASGSLLSMSTKSFETDVIPFTTPLRSSSTRTRSASSPMSIGAFPGIDFSKSSSLTRSISARTTPQRTIHSSFASYSSTRCKCMVCDMSSSSDCKKVSVESAEEAISLFKRCFESRQTASTKRSTHSSRSHVICTVFVERRKDEGLDPESVGKVVFVDLAGGDRVRDGEESDSSGNHDIHDINLSLLALGEVLEALATNSALPKNDPRRVIVPYSHSKLTQLLREAFSGQSLTSIITHVSPYLDDYQQTIHAIDFSNRVRGVRNAALTADKKRLMGESIRETVRHRYQNDSEDEKAHSEIDVSEVAITPNRNFVRLNSVQISPYSFTGSTSDVGSVNWRPKEYLRLTKENEAMRTDLLESKTSLSKKTLEITRLHKEVESLRYQNSTLSKQRLKDLKAVESEHNKTVLELNSKISENQKLDKKMKSAQIENEFCLRAKNEEIAKLALENNMFKLRVSELTAANATETDKMKHCLLHSDNLLVENKELKQNINNLELKVKSLTDELFQQAEVAKSSAVENDNLRRSMAAMISQFKKDEAEFSEKLYDLAQSLSKKEMEKAAEFTEQINHLHQIIHEKDGELQLADVSCQQLQSHLKSIENDKSQLTLSLKTLDSEKSALQSEIDDLGRRFSEVKMNWNVSEEKNSILKKESLQEKEYVNQLLSNLSKLKEENAKLQSTSLHQQKNSHEITEELRRELTLSSEQVQHLRNMVETLSTSAEINEAKFVALEMECTKRSDEVQEAQRQIQSLNSAQSNCMHSISMQNIELEKKQLRVNELEASALQSSEQIKLLREKLEMQSKMSEENSSRLTELLSNVEGDVQDLRIQRDALLRDLKLQKDNLNDSLSRLDDAKQTIQALQVKLSNALSQEESMKSSLSFKEGECIKLRRDLNEIEMQNKDLKASLHNKTQQLEKANKSCEEFTNRVDTLEVENSHLLKEKEYLQAEVTSLTTMSQELVVVVEELDSLKNCASLADEEVSKLRRENSRQKEAIQLSTIENKSLREDALRMHRESESYRRKLEEIQQEFLDESNRLANSISSLRTENELLKEESLLIERRNLARSSSLNDEKLLMMKEREEIEGQLSDCRKQLHGVNAELERVTMKNSDTEALLLQAKIFSNGIIQKHSEEIDRLEKNNAELLNLKVAEKEERILQVANIQRDRDIKINEAIQSLSSLQNELLALHNEHKKVKNESNIQNAERNQLIKKLEQASSQNSSLVQQLATMKQELEGKNQNLITADSLINQLKSELANAHVEISKMITRIESLEAEVSTLSVLSQKVPILTQEVDEIRKKYLEMESKTSKLTAENIRLENDLKSVYEDNASLRLQCNRLQQELVTQLEASRSESDGLQQRIENLTLSKLEIEAASDALLLQTAAHISVLNNSLNISTADLLEFTKENEAYSVKVTELKEQLQRTTSLIDSQLKETSELKNSNIQLQAGLATAMGKISATDSRCAYLSDIIAEKNAEIKNLHDSLREHKSQILSMTTAREELVNLQTRNETELLHEINRLESLIELFVQSDDSPLTKYRNAVSAKGVSEGLATLHEELARLIDARLKQDNYYAETFHDLEERLQSSQNELGSTMSAYDDARSRIEEAENRHLEMTEKLLSLQSELDMLTMKLAEVNSQNSTTQRNIIDLQEELLTVRDEKGRLSDLQVELLYQMREKDVFFIKYATENEALTMHIEEHLTKLAVANAEVQKLKREKSSDAEVIRALRINVEALERESIFSKKSADSGMRTVMDLKKEISIHENELSSIKRSVKDHIQKINQSTSNLPVDFLSNTLHTDLLNCGLSVTHLVESLRRELLAAKNARLDSEEHIRELSATSSAQIEQYNSDILTLQERIRMLEKQERVLVKEIESQKSNGNEAVMSLQSQICSLQQSMELKNSNQQKQNEEHERILQSWMKREADLLDEMETLRAEFNSCNSASITHCAENARLGDELIDANRKLRLLEKETSTLRDEFKHRCNELSNEISMHIESKGALSQQIAIKDNELSKLLGKIASKDADVLRLSDELRCSKEEYASNSNELMTARKLLNTREFAINNLKNELDLLMAEKASLTSSNSDLLAAIKRAQSDVTAKENECQNLRLKSAQQVQNFQSEMAKLNDNLHMKDDLLSELHHKMSVADTRYQSETISSSNVIFTLQRTLSQRDSKLQSLENDLELLKVQFGEQSESLLMKSKKLDEVQKEFQLLEGQCLESTRESTRCVQALKTLQEESISERVDLWRKIQELEEVKQTSDAELMQQQNLYSTLQQEVVALKNDIATRDLEINQRDDQIVKLKLDFSHIENKLIRASAEHTKTAADLTAKFTELNNQLSMKELENSVLSADNNKLKMLLHEHSREKSVESTRASDRIAKMVELFTAQTNKLQVLASENDRLQDIIERMKKNSAEQTAKLMDSDAEVKSITEKLHVIATERSELQFLLSEKEATLQRIIADGQHKSFLIRESCEKLHRLKESLHHNTDISQDMATNKLISTWQSSEMEEEALASVVFQLTNLMWTKLLQHEKTTAECSDLKISLNDLAKAKAEEILHLNRQLDELKSMANLKSDDLSRLHTEKNRLREELTNMQSTSEQQMKEMASLVSRKDDELLAMRKQLEHLETNYITAKDQNTSLVGEIFQLNSRIKSLDCDIDTHRKRCELLGNERKNISDQLKEAMSERVDAVNDLNMQVSKLQKTLNIEIEKNNELSKSMDELIRKGDNEHRDSIQLQQSHKKQMEDFCLKMTDRETEILSLRNEIGRYSSNESLVMLSARNMQTHISDLTTKISVMEGEMDQLKKENLALQYQLTSLEHQKSDEINQLNQCRYSDMAAAEKHLNEVKHNLQESLEERTRLVESHKRMDDMIAVLRNSSAEKNAMIQSHSDELESLQQKIDSLQRINIQQTDAQKAKEEEYNHSLLQKSKELQTANESAALTIISLNAATNEVNELKMKILSLTAVVDVTDAEMRLLKSENENLRRKIQQVEIDFHSDENSLNEKLIAQEEELRELQQTIHDQCKQITDFELNRHQELSAMQADLNAARATIRDKSKELFDQIEGNDDLKKQLQIKSEQSQRVEETMKNKLVEMQQLLAVYSEECKTKEIEKSVILGESARASVHLRSELDASSSRLQELSRQNDEKASKIVELSRASISQASEIHALRDQIAKMKNQQDDHSRLKVQAIEEWQNQVANMTVEILEKSKQVHSLNELLESKTKDHQYQVSQLEMELKNNKVRSNELSNQLEAKGNELRNAQLELSNLKSVLNDQSSFINDFKLTLAAKQSEHESTTESMKSIRNQLSMKESELAMVKLSSAESDRKLNMERIQLAEQLLVANREIDASKRSIQELQQQLEEKSAVERNLTAKIAADGKNAQHLLEEMKELLSQKSAECSAQDLKLTRLRNQLAEVSDAKISDIDTTNALISDMRRILASKTKDLDAHVVQVDKLRQQVHHLEDEKSYMEKEMRLKLTQSEDRAQELLRQLDDANREVDNLKRVVSSHNLSQQRLTEQHSKLTVRLEHSTEEADKYKTENMELHRQISLLSENQSKEAAVYSKRMSELRELSSKSLSMSSLISELESALSAKSADLMKSNDQLTELMGLLTSNTKEMQTLSDEKRHLVEELDKTKRNVSEISQILQAKAQEAMTWKEQANMNRKLAEDSNIKNMAEVDAANQQIAKLFEVIADRNEELKSMTLKQQQQDILIQKMRDFEKDRIPVHQIISDMHASWEGEGRIMQENLQRMKRQVHEISMSSSSGLGGTPGSAVSQPERNSSGVSRSVSPTRPTFVKISSLDNTQVIYKCQSQF